jgi:glycosyltransferase involved in cell wall biosynthesis
VPRRLVFVNRYFLPDVSATGQMLGDLVRALSADGWELHIICSRQLYGDAGRQLPAAERIGAASVHRVWSACFGRDRLIGRSLDYVTFGLTATRAMLRWTRPGDVLVAMTDPPLISICAAAVARRRRAQLINWLQDIFPEVAVALGTLRWAPALARTLSTLRDWSLRSAQTNVVLGQRMHATVTALGIAPHRQRIIENWADGAAVKALPVQASSLRGSVAAEPSFVVQYSGNLGRAQDFRTLLAAAEKLRAESGWLFLFTGGGANMQRLAVQATSHGLTNMRFLPHQPRAALGDSLAAGDVHVSCLLPPMEGLIVPSKFYGILAAGRPVIVIGDPEGEHARIVRASGCGAVVACGDSDGLVQALRRMRADSAWIQEAGRRARCLFEERYTLDAAADKWRQVLRQLALQEARCPSPSCS